ncbi:MAG: Peptide chain release factor 1 [Candidatus Ozemobacter sibiricus]|jgi:peptide chain release factor 1|uniref:Peptide chain release factor 1 n=1 Tax=Candidatus Ozemobacter sibiricus TaxID=2268124 RepID=A0A367ZQ46_9BACT|nr:MAG: Peptide chain release factor 1 [Candidatus Ozemobacter sibiricus]
MFDKLAALCALYDDLTTKLSDPAVLGNPAELQKIAKKRAELEPIKTAYSEFAAVRRQLEEAEQLLGTETDPEMRAMAEEETVALRKRLAALGQELKLLLIPKDEDDGKNTIIEIRAGTGGEEAALFAADLYRMYSRYADRQGWKCEVMSLSETGLGGIKEVIFGIQGQGVYGKLKFESGVHRVQRVPETEASGRIHTSAATVAVLPEAEEVDVQIDEKDLRIDVFRSSGPGGQSVNTTDSAVRVTHLPTGIVVSCQDEKSQHKNKAKALRILRARLLDNARAEQDKNRAENRRMQIGTGDRSERIRTYNFPQQRMTDHRIGLTLYKLPEILDGDLDETIRSLIEADNLKKLAATAAEPE